MKRKRSKSKPMTCVACDFNKAALEDAAAQFQQADEALRTELLRTACLREEIERLTDERDKAISWIHCAIVELVQAGGETGDRTVALRNLRKLIADLAHSDEHRRMLERDIRAQQDELAKLQPFNRILQNFPPAQREQNQ
jgi:hypothetical protein